MCHHRGGVSPCIRPILVIGFMSRASAGGDLYGIWHTDSHLQAFRRSKDAQIDAQGHLQHDAFDYLASRPRWPYGLHGPRGALDPDGKPVRGAVILGPGRLLSSPFPRPMGPIISTYRDSEVTRRLHPRQWDDDGEVTASVHAAADGTRLLTVRDLRRNRHVGINNESFIQDDFTLEKRFHFVPAANLLVTIPFTNDRPSLRRLDIHKTLEKLSEVTTWSSRAPFKLYAIDRQGVQPSDSRSFRSRAVSEYAIAQGPEGLAVSTTGKLTWLPPRAGGAPLRSRRRSSPSPI